MGETNLEDINISPPDPGDLAASVAGGVMNPLLKERIDINLPEPPPRYPVGVASTNMIPTQTNRSSNINSLIEESNNSLKTANQWARNPYHYAKTKTYNADYDGANFKRYASVPRVFKEHGFSLYRDNEGLYNENATWWDYYKRSAGASWELFKTGFNDMLPWNAWDGKSADLVAAKEMERWHAIGADSRSGAGAFMNNMTVDSGYTFGILAEFAAEEIVLWGATVLSGGASGELAAARTVKKVGDVKDALSLVGLRKNIGRAYDWMRSPEKMKDVYGYAKGTLKSAGKAIVPQTANFIAHDILAAGKTGDLVFDMAKTSKGFGAFYRDSRAVAAVLSEASLEGGSAELMVRDQLIDGYYEKNGRTPSDEEMVGIYQEAANAGRQTYLWNLPALYISNQIVFETALKGFKPAAVFREELSQGLSGRLAYNAAWKKAGKVAWSTVKTDAWSGAKSLFQKSTYAPKNLLKNTVGRFALYTKANLAEGLQEVYQDAVQKTMIDYYSARFTHPALAGSRSMWGDFAKNIGNPSLETFASGFLMGSMVQVPQKVAFNYLPKQFYKLTNRAEYDQYMEMQEKNTTKVVDALNAATMDEKFYNAINENAVVQLNGNAEAQQANMAGDIKAFGDITDESVANHLITLAESGKMGILVDQFKDLKGLNKEALEEAFGPVEKDVAEDSYAFYQKKLDSMIKKSEQITKLYETAEREIGEGPYDPRTVDPTKDPLLYKEVLQGSIAWKKAKRDFVVQNYSFARTLKRIDDVTNKLVSNTNLAKASATDLMVALTPQLLVNEIGITEQELRGYKAVEKDTTNKNKIDELEDRLDYLKDLQSAIDSVTLAQKLEPERGLGINLKEIEDVDKAARIDIGTVVKNKKGNEHKVDYIKRGVAYNKKGEKIGKLVDLDIISQPEGKVDKTAIELSLERLYSAYSKWMKYSAKVNSDDTITDSAIAKSFPDYKDVFLLKQDSKFLGESIETLLNPNNFMFYVERIKSVIADIDKSRQTLLRNSYNRFLRLKRINELFNQLYEMKVFLDEDGMKKVLDNMIPLAFFDIPKAGKSITQIDIQSDKYKQILDLFEKYEQTSGKEFKGKPILEATPFTLETMHYNIENRSKEANLISGNKDDQRTLVEHAAYWEFDPEMKIMTSVKTLDILKKVVDSPYATYKEKALARRLLTIVKGNSEIKFEKLSRPNKSLYTDEGKMGMSVDPRYASSDYMYAKDFPIEALILNSIIKDITAYDMSKNILFQKDVAKLFEAAKEEFKKNRPADAELFGDKAGLEFYGLRNQEDFVAEALTNDRFAAWLKTITYATTGKSSWQELLDVISKFFTKLLGISADNTLLDEVLFVVTNHIDRIEGVSEDSLAQEARYKTATQTGTNVPGGISKDSTINELAGSGVLGELVFDYKRVNAERAQVAPDSVYDSLYDQRPESELIETEGFKNYLQSTSASNIISAHNKKKGVTTPAPAAQSYQSDPRQKQFRKLELMKAAGVNLEDFFATLPWASRGEVLWKAIRRRITQDKKLKILSSGKFDNQGELEDKAKGKMRWVETNLGIGEDRVIIESEKEKYAKADTILIDDFKDNTESFINAGGKAILHTDAVDTITQLEKLIDENPGVEFTVYLDLDGVLVDLFNSVIDYDLSATATTTTTATTSTPLTKGTKERLKVKGYSVYDFNSMDEETGKALLAEGLTKKQKQEALAAAEESERQIKLEKEKLAKEGLMKSVKDDIDQAEYLSDFAAIQNKVSDIIHHTPGVLDTDRIDELIKIKKQKLTENITFDNIVIGEFIRLDNNQLDNNQLVKVIEKNNNGIKVQTTGKIEDGASQVEFWINKKQFDKGLREPNKRYVMYKDQPGMEEVTGIPVTSEEDIESTKGNVVSARTIVSDEDLQSEFEEVKSQEIVDLEKDFLDTLDQCLPGNQLSIF